MAPAESWWQTAVVYQVYIRSFADGNGDGVGDIAGLRDRLPYLARLGVDAIWINPWYPSPLADGGYDVADYRDVEPLYGTLRRGRPGDRRGARGRHPRAARHRAQPQLRSAPWFVAALAGDPKARQRYHFRDRSRPRRGAAAQRLAERLRRARLDQGAPTGSGTCTSSHPANPTSTGRTRRCAPNSRTSWRSGSTRASTASASTSRTDW